ncbi:3398_t:CDS:2 [Diversispora eburnea]|uniref:Biogenesis of lysosome-related organelles complex 1 subunit 5 n=1 Tax=Diversispora eburnea TaxID=1213867 RepID=A0A9N9FW06_9GLOM|nr:3398_t:CDS:2 [Diversispora eburnea]
MTKNIGNLYNTIFNHPKSSVDKEIKLFVQEFESNRNGRETENLKKSIAYAQDAPNKYENGISLLNKKLDKRREFLREQENAKNKLDQEFKLKEQELISEYRLMMEEALRGVDNFSVISSSSGNSEYKFEE